MSRRVEQLGATLQTALQELISRGLQDPRISGLITITGVEVSPDLKSAFVAVSVLPQDRQDLTLHGLKSAAGHLRHVLGDKLSTRQVPELVFRVDKTLKTQAGVLEALSRVREEQERKGTPPTALTTPTTPAAGTPPAEPAPPSAPPREG